MPKPAARRRHVHRWDVHRPRVLSALKRSGRTLARSMVVAAVLAGAAVTAALADNAAVERGAYLAAATGCVTCHTDRENNAADYAGGHRLETPFGVFVTPNITPDRETGIGNWTEAQFAAAVREGINPAGGYYYPAFPYASYAGISDADVADLKAYFDSLPAVSRPNAASELEWYVPGRWAMTVWQQLFSPWAYPQEKGDTELQRGAYLVRHLGHCGECHTPRNIFGGLDTGRELAGTPKDSLSGSAPAINAEGLKNWSQSEVEFFLEIGMSPDGDFAGSGMGAVIDDNTGKLTPEDRRAIARFLLSRE